MKVDRKLGEHLRLELLPVGRQSSQVFMLLESDIMVAWNRVARTMDPRFSNPTICGETEGWSIQSSLTGEKLALVSLVVSTKARPKS